jgi:hypothetical protein
MDDVRAVMTWSPRGLVLWSGTEGSRTTTLFAASPRVHDRPRRLNLSIKGAAHRRYPWAPSDATWRETLLFSSDQRGSAEFCAGARGRGRATRLSTMRGEYTWVDDSTHETTKGAAKEPSASGRTTTSRTSQSGLEERSNSRSVAAWVVIFA